MSKPTKPLGRKAYGSIPHLPGSRLGPADHHCDEGQARIVTERLRDKRDILHVTEKLDGACMAVANIDGQIVALTRAGYRAVDGTYEHLRLFSPWVAENEWRFKAALNPGQRFVGEWLALAHGTRYGPGDPFIVFDVMDCSGRLPIVEMQAKAGVAELPAAHILYMGQGAFSISDAMNALGSQGYHGALEKPEGAVWRVERDGKFDFMCKYVRPDKQDGKYLSDVSGCAPVWMRGVSA